MSLGRIAVGWLAVAVWLLAWQWGEGRALGAGTIPAGEAVDVVGEAVVVTLFAALWFASLGAGAWWLVFLLVGVLREWSPRTGRATLRILRLIGAGGVLAWILPG